MKRRNVILTMLVILGMVTFLDRINISVAGATIMDELNLTPLQWGWVQSAFILSYGLMQMPMGAFGDRHGHRRVLTLIVVWWSAFTCLTGLAGGLASLLVIRFMFGIGEAGSSPCSTGVISRWFPKEKVGRAQGFIWAATRFGGALTPFVVIPVMALVGWREAFFLLGALGLVWAAVWYIYYRDKPAESDSAPQPAKQSIPWKQMFHNRQFWIICGMYFFYAFGSWFFFSWFPTFMELGRGFAKSEMTYAVAVPFVMSMIGNISGGYLTDYLTRRYGVKVGRKAVGSAALAVSAVCMTLAALIPGKTAVFIFLSLCFGIFDLMLPSAWALCIDLGKQFAGSVSGAMNTAGNIGGFCCGILFGWLVNESGNYNLPLFMISGTLVLSAILFAFINPEKPIIRQ